MLVSESSICNGWIVRYGLVGYGIGVYASQLVVVVESKDVCKETIVGRYIFGPRVDDVLNLSCLGRGSLLEDLVVFSGWPPMYSCEGCGAYCVERGCLGLLCG